MSIPKQHLVDTDKGRKMAGEIRVGDMVLTDKMRPRKVTVAELVKPESPLVWLSCMSDESRALALVCSSDDQIIVTGSAREVKAIQKGDVIDAICSKSLHPHLAKVNEARQVNAPTKEDFVHIEVDEDNSFFANGLAISMTARP